MNSIPDTTRPVHDWRAFGLTDPGRVRTENQDAFRIDLRAGLFIVSDGMGGRNAGATASRAVIEVLPLMLEQRMRKERPPEDQRGRIVRECALELSRQIWQQASGRPGLSGMGATLALLLTQGPRALAVHMGDSRVYLHRDGKLDRLTEDHSVAHLLEREGQISGEEARSHPSRRSLSRYIGMESEAYPDVREIEALPGDRFLLCSDGLTEMVNDAAIARLLAGPRSPESVCRELIEAANSDGGVDNITALVVERT